MKFPLLGLTIAALGFGFWCPVQATVTIEFYFEDGMIPDGALAALVADTGDDGFLTMADPSISGTTLTVGSGIGGGNDIILSLMNASAGAEWHSGAGIGDTLAAIDYDALGVTEGMELAVYVFPDLTRQDGNLIIGDRFTIYRNDSAGGSGGSIPFEAPADPGVYTLSVLTTDNGGDFEPNHPGTGESYEMGNTGMPAGLGLDDHGNSRRDATMITNGQSLSGSLSPGDLDFFQLELVDLSYLLATPSGSIFSRGLLYDENGNLVDELSPANDNLVRNTPIQVGTYYFALIGDGGSQDGAYDLKLKRNPIVTVRPDITIGKSVGGQRGDGVYNATGGGQTYTGKSQKGKRVSAIFSVGNDGDAHSEVDVQGSRSDGYYKVKYFKLTGGRANITSQVARGGGFSIRYESMERRTFQVQLKPTGRAKKRRKRGKFAIDAAGGDSSDRAGLKVKIVGR